MFEIYMTKDYCVKFGLQYDSSIFFYTNPEVYFQKNGKIMFGFVLESKEKAEYYYKHLKEYRDFIESLEYYNPISCIQIMCHRSKNINNFYVDYSGDKLFISFLNS